MKQSLIYLPKPGIRKLKTQQRMAKGIGMAGNQTLSVFPL